MIFGGPGGCREVREVQRKQFCKFSPKMLRRIPSYDHKTKQNNDKKSNNNFNVSVKSVYLEEHGGKNIGNRLLFSEQLSRAFIQQAFCSFFLVDFGNF